MKVFRTYKKHKAETRQLGAIGLTVTIAKYPKA